MIANSRNYGEIFKTVCEIVLSHDPVGLVDEGAPHDEYNPEVSLALHELRGLADRNEIANRLRDIFAHQFDDNLAGPIEAYQRIADALLESYPRGLPS